MTSLELVKDIVHILDQKKGMNIQAIKVRDLTIVADYFVIAGATSTTHVKSLADEVEYQIKKDDEISPARVEGYGSASWVLIDYGEVIVHIFNPEAREFYKLERLWADGEPVDLSEFGIGEA